MSIIVALDGVIRDSHGDQVYAGVKLYKALSETYSVVLVTDSTAMEAERWCRMHGILNYSEIIDNSSSWPSTELRMRQVEVVRSHGRRVEFVLEADPGLAPQILSTGVPVVLFSHPKPTKPEFSIRKWDEISDELQRQREAAAGLDTDLTRWE